MEGDWINCLSRINEVFLILIAAALCRIMQTYDLQVLFFVRYLGAWQDDSVMGGAHIKSIVFVAAPY